MFKKILSMLLCCMMLFAMVGCTSRTEEVGELVKGNLDTLYLGVFDKKHVVKVEDSLADLEALYEESMYLSGEMFAMYWGIFDEYFGETYDTLSDGLKAEIDSLMREVYKKAKYEIGEVKQVNDSLFEVQATVYPIDVIATAQEAYLAGSYAPLNDFWAKYANVYFEDLDAEAQAAYTEEYGQLIVQLVREEMAGLDYLEPVTHTLRYELTDEVWMLNGDDLEAFDWDVLRYVYEENAESAA